jgi:dienelactone hydrolase
MTASTVARLPRVVSRVRATEAGLFRLAAGLVGLHVVDDNYLQPEPGTSPADHVVSGLVPLALLVLAAWVYPRLRGARRGTLALALGVLGIVVGVPSAHYARAVGASGDDFTGLLCLPAGALLLGLGAVTLWRTRRREGSLARRGVRRAAYGAAGVALLGFVLVPVSIGYITTHAGRAVVPTNDLGVPYEDVALTTPDGLRLEGWYIPSRNGAAVVAFPGRRGSQEKARMLARHGYGVLLFDRRGEGVSEGEPNSWGWGGDADAKAAIAWLQRRPDVDPERIGGIGLSVGGEMLIETAAETDELAAVVSDGAGARSTYEDLHRDDTALGKVLGTFMSAVKTATVAVASNQLPPDDLEDLAARVEQPMLLIAAPNSGHGEELNRGYARAAGRSATLWEIPEAGHMGGQAARPAEYERRVVGFFDRALRP